ncbi:energy transducer TonB [Silvimonas amylolytica]|nr:energy transducer TonB [Silvimonas amylolytica]
MESWANPEQRRERRRWGIQQTPVPAGLAARVACNPAAPPTRLRRLLLALVMSGLIHYLAFMVPGTAQHHHDAPPLPAPLTLQIILPSLQAPARLAPVSPRQAPQNKKPEPTETAATRVQPGPAKAAPRHSPALHNQTALHEPVASTAVTPALPASSPVISTEPAVSVSRPATSSPADEVVSEARADADYLHNPPPVYPDFAQARGWAGHVQLKVHVLASGRPDQVELQQSCGHTLLDDAARRAVQAWAFVPAKRGNIAIDSWVSVPIDFKLSR